MVGPQQTTGLIGQKWKTGNGLELTGTNRPTQTTTPHPPHNRGGVGETAAKCEASTIRSTPNPPPQPHPPTRRRWAAAKEGGRPHNLIAQQTAPHRTANSRLGGHSDRETPGPIPNPEAKPDSADGTAPARVRESRTPPSTHHRRAHEITTISWALLSFAAPTAQLRCMRVGAPDDLTQGHLTVHHCLRD